MFRHQKTPDTKAAGFKNKVAALAKNKKGVSAIEFALLAPVFILLLFASFDAVLALNAQRKITVAANVVSDLATRDDSISCSDRDGLVTLAHTIITPFDINASEVVFSGLRVEPDGRNAIVEWSEGSPGADLLETGRRIDLPSEISPDTFLILSNVSVPYTTQLGFLDQFAGGSLITLSDQALFSSRLGVDILSDCTA